MPSLFGRAAALFSARAADPEPQETCLERMVARQKAVKTSGVLQRLTPADREEATVPLYGPSAYNSLGSTEPWDQ